MVSCDLYIGILGLRYGYIPKATSENPHQLSITELGCRRAVECGIRRLIFLKDESAILAIQSDAFTGENPQERIRAFRSEASKAQRPTVFSNPSELRERVLQSFLQFKSELTRQRRTQKSGAKKLQSQRTARPSPSRRIFVCYRRHDSGIIVGRIYDRLVNELGKENVFKDVDTIPFGVDFVKYLDGEVQKCSVLFAVIGPRWLEPGPEGEPRLNDPDDFVRIEIAAALRRDIPVVPLLVDGAQMPRADRLPEELKALSRRNGTEIRHDPDFHTDLTRLLSRLG